MHWVLESKSRRKGSDVPGSLLVDEERGQWMTFPHWCQCFRVLFRVLIFLVAARKASSLQNLL